MTVLHEYHLLFCCDLFAAPEANMQTFPPNNRGDKGRGYQSLAGPSGMARLSVFLYFTFGCSPYEMFGDYCPAFTFLADLRFDCLTLDVDVR